MLVEFLRALLHIACELPVCALPAGLLGGGELAAEARRALTAPADEPIGEEERRCAGAAAGAAAAEGPPPAQESARQPPSPSGA